MGETDDDSDARGSSGVRSILNAIAVIEKLAVMQPVGVSSLARALEMPKSSLQRTLQTLEHAGWVRLSREGPRQWSFGEKFFQLSSSLRSTERPLREIAMETMMRLRDRYGETMHLSALDGPDIVIVARIDGTQSLRTFLELGERAPLLLTAGGRAMLGEMDPALRNRLIAESAGRHPGDSRFYDPELIGDIDVCKARGYAINRELWRSEIGAISSPLVSTSGRVVGAISLSTPISRLDSLMERGVGEVLAEAVKAIRFSNGELL